MNIRKINLLRDTEPIINLLDGLIRSKKKMRTYIEEIVQSGGTILICEEQNAIVAFIIIEIIDLPFNKEIFPEISHYFVAFSHRDRGIEKFLFEEAEKWCSYRKFNELRILVQGKSRDLHRFAKQLNYQDVGVIKSKSI